MCRAAQSCTSRLLKKAHLLRWRAWALVAAYRKYASLGPSRSALHLGLFEQPEQRALQQPKRYQERREYIVRELRRAFHTPLAAGP